MITYIFLCKDTTYAILNEDLYLLTFEIMLLSCFYAGHTQRKQDNLSEYFLRDFLLSFSMLAIDMVSVVNINYKFLHCLVNLTKVNLDLYCTSTFN